MVLDLLFIPIFNPSVGRTFFQASKSRKSKRIMGSQVTGGLEMPKKYLLQRVKTLYEA